MITEITVGLSWVNIGVTQAIISNPSRTKELFVTTDNGMKGGIPIPPLHSKEIIETGNLYVKGNSKNCLVVLDDNL